MFGPARSTKSLPYPRHWHDLPQGDQIKRQVEIALERVSRQFFGYYLVRLGNLSSQLELTSLPVKQQVCQGKVEADGNHLVSSSLDLPYQNNSVDTFVLAHELDFCKDPHQLLREVNRAITPDGFVVICGFNPLSLAGIASLLPSNRRELLGDARLFTPWRIKDWLQLLGFELIEDRSLMFSSLLFDSANTNARWRRRLLKWLPWFGSVYLLVARKRTLPLLPAKSKWKTAPKFSVVGASVRLLPEETAARKKV